MKKSIDLRQIRKIYAIGNELGITERKDSRDGGLHNDSLHDLISVITGKDSVKKLDTEEAEMVIRELEKRQGRHTPRKKTDPEKKREKVYPDGITPGQTDKIWALMYALRSFDQSESSCSLGKRLTAIIRKELHRDCPEKEPLIWIDYRTAFRLIEILKKYVKNAETKARERDGTS